MVRAALLSVLVGAACCHTSTPPQPAPVVTATTIYNELVVAGCMAQDDGGPATVAQEHALPDQEPWMACLWDGGTVMACGVPCDAASTKKK